MELQEVYRFTVFLLGGEDPPPPPPPSGSESSSYYSSTMLYTLTVHVSPTPQYIQVLELLAEVLKSKIEFLPLEISVSLQGSSLVARVQVGLGMRLARVWNGIVLWWECDTREENSLT